jgi:hypothetical protein
MKGGVFSNLVVSTAAATETMTEAVGIRMSVFERKTAEFVKRGWTL